MACEFCTPKYRPLFETPFWKVHLVDDQSYLGRCVVTLKRHAGTLSLLTNEEWKDFGQIARRVESVLTKAFEPQMFNWSCLLDASYKEEYPDPHVHFHVRPRYSAPVTFSNVTFDDPDFGNHYDRTRKREISDDVNRSIRERILHYV